MNDKKELFYEKKNILAKICSYHSFALSRRDMCDSKNLFFISWVGMTEVFKHLEFYKSAPSRILRVKKAMLVNLVHV